jgi:hypothetical protein
MDLETLIRKEGVNKGSYAGSRDEDIHKRIKKSAPKPAVGFRNRDKILEEVKIDASSGTTLIDLSNHRNNIR